MHFIYLLNIVELCIIIYIKLWGLINVVEMFIFYFFMLLCNLVIPHNPLGVRHLTEQCENVHPFLFTFFLDVDITP